MEEVVVKLERILGKPLESFSNLEIVLVSNMYKDRLRGRYSPVFNSTKSSIEKFFDYVYENEEESYSNLTDPTRWALEDVFFEKV